MNEKLLEKALARIDELNKENDEFRQVISGQAARIETLRREKEQCSEIVDRVIDNLQMDKTQIIEQEQVIGKLPVCPYCATKDEEISDCPAIAFPGDADFHECAKCGKEYRVEMVEGYVTEKSEEGE